jgi:hypothetical protein
MELQDILKGLKAKAAEAKKMTGLNSKHFAFKNWHTTVMQLLKELPTSYISLVNDFKALTFEDTGFKRGRKFSSSSDNTKFLEDLEASGNILKEIAKTAKKEEDDKSKKTSSSKPKKPPQPAKKPPGEKTVRKTGPRKAPGSSGSRKPAKTGSSTTRKKKKS